MPRPSCSWRWPVRFRASFWAALFLVVTWGGVAAQWPQPVWGVLEYLGWLNIVLAVFNLIPAFPLDGGRVLRSILWAVKGDLRWATRIAAALGSGFGMLLIVLGLSPSSAANYHRRLVLPDRHVHPRGRPMSYRQMLIRNALCGEQVSHFMETEPVTVPPSISIRELVEDYFYEYHYKMFPVSSNSGLQGCINSRRLRTSRETNGTSAACGARALLDREHHLPGYRRHGGPGHDEPHRQQPAHGGRRHTRRHHHPQGHAEVPGPQDGPGGQVYRLPKWVTICSCHRRLRGSFLAVALAAGRLTQPIHFA